MDLFRFLNPTAATLFEQGEMLNGLRNVIWVERYRDAGDFTITAGIDTDLRNLLPIGSFISHVDSNEVMIVENHEINDTRGEASIITITGRGFETFLENRLVGTNRAFPSSGTLPVYSLAAAPLWQQVKTMLENHILPSNVVDANDAIPYITVASTMANVDNADARVIPTGPLYAQMLGLLALGSLGIRVVRPGPTSPLGAASPNLGLVIHGGVDRSATIVFSDDIGDIRGADYLWSNKKVRNCVLVSGRWLETMVKTTAAGYDRRVMHIDGSDIDRNYQTEPIGPDRTYVLATMVARGYQALISQKAIALSKVEAARNSSRYTFGVDYSIGDVVMVSGDYNATQKARVTEYVRISDKVGDSGYPTLALL